MFTPVVIDANLFAKTGSITVVYTTFDSETPVAATTKSQTKYGAITFVTGANVPVVFHYFHNKITEYIQLFTVYK